MASVLRNTFARSARRSLSTLTYTQPIASSSTSSIRLALPRSSNLLHHQSSGVIPRSRSSELAKRWNSSSSSQSGRGDVAAENPAIEAPTEGAKPQKIAQIEPRLQMTFTCTANDCGHRSTHEFSKRAYTKGLVLVQCPECKARHLIADHIGWFKESTEEGKLKTVEDLLAAKGEKIRKGRVNFDGDIEYEGDD
ncbi:hypothetical protein IAU59_007139 [Kwoniella sp. CBS 9459]